MQLTKLKTLVTTTLDELKATDIVTINVQDITSVTDLMVICSGRSTRHIKSLANNLINTIKKQGVRPQGIEGQEVGHWVLVDLGDVIVHIMHPEAREFYHLESLWDLPQDVSE